MKNIYYKLKKHFSDKKSKRTKYNNKLKKLNDRYRECKTNECRKEILTKILKHTQSKK